ncbi:polyhydroxyalkanoate synthesis regulator DNA-binding domain-containing protein [Suttonella ornithocola]|nr:polyhydroxyalkanoate synthesis regulator DNA-binding domain-containing protein [Suttonella ornithocola]
MSVRKIKKYPNRRLYDTVASHYVKSDDIQRLLSEGERVSIVDAQSGRDITRSVLLNILAEEALDETAAPLFSEAMLAEAVRFDDNFLAGILALFLEKSMQMFLKHQHIFQEQMRNFDSEGPLSTIEKLIALQAETLTGDTKQISIF